MTAIRVYGPGDPDHVHLVSRSVPFASCDPGGQGAVLVWKQGPAQAWPVEPDAAISITRDAGGADIAAGICARFGVRVFLLEDQFLGRQTRNFKTTKKLIFTAGIVVGRVLGACEIDDLVQLQASTWQVGLPPGDDSKSRAIMLSRRLVPGWIDKYRGGMRSGCADAMGIADWFASEVKR